MSHVVFTHGSEASNAIYRIDYARDDAHSCDRCGRVIPHGSVRWSVERREDERIEQSARSTHFSCVTRERCQEMMIAHSGGARGLRRDVGELDFITYWQCASQARGFRALRDDVRHGVGFYFAALARGREKALVRFSDWVRSNGTDDVALRRALRMSGPKANLELIFDNEAATWRRMNDDEDARRSKAAAWRHASQLTVDVNARALARQTSDLSNSDIESPRTPGTTRKRRKSASEASSCDIFPL